MTDSFIKFWKETFGSSTQSVEIGYFAEMVAYHFHWEDDTQKLYDIINFAITSDPYTLDPYKYPKEIKYEEILFFISRFGGTWNEGKCFKLAIKNLINHKTGLIHSWWLGFCTREEALEILQKASTNDSAFGAIRYNDSKETMDIPFKCSYTRGKQAKHIYIKQNNKNNRYSLFLDEKTPPSKEYETLNEFLTKSFDYVVTPVRGKIYETLLYFQRYRFLSENGEDEIYLVPEKTPKYIISQLDLRYHYPRRKLSVDVAATIVPCNAPYAPQQVNSHCQTPKIAIEQDSFRAIDFLQFPDVLKRLVRQYWLELRMEDQHIFTRKLDHPSCGLFSDLNYFYICHCIPKISIKAYNFNGSSENDMKWPILDHPWGMDKDENFYYIIGCSHVYILDICQREILTSWKLPYTIKDKKIGGHGMKIDQSCIYFTLSNYHQVFIHSKLDGKNIKRLGNPLVDHSNTHNGFRTPCGLTIVNNNLYICDQDNDRIQIVNKDTYDFLLPWNKQNNTLLKEKFIKPHSIYYYEECNNFFISDLGRILLTTEKGEIVQKIDLKNDNKNSVESFTIAENKLFVSDYVNLRIQAFRMTWVR